MFVGFAPGDPTFFGEAIQRAYEDKCSLALYSENLELEVRRLRALVDDLGGDNNSFVDEWNILRRALEEAVQKVLAAGSVLLVFLSLTLFLLTMLLQEENLAKALAEAKASRKDAVLKVRALLRGLHCYAFCLHARCCHCHRPKPFLVMLSASRYRMSD